MTNKLIFETKLKLISAIKLLKKDECKLLFLKYGICPFENSYNFPKNPHQIKNNIIQSNLFNTVSYTKDLESIYKKI